MLDFNSLIQLVIGLVAGLVGFPALVSTIVTAMEYFNWLAPENTDTVIFWANAVAFVGVFVLALTGKIDLVNAIDSTLGQLAQIVTMVLILMGVPAGFAIAKAQHAQIRAARFLGFRDGVG